MTIQPPYTVTHHIMRKRTRWSFKRLIKIHVWALDYIAWAIQIAWTSHTYWRIISTQQQLAWIKKIKKVNIKNTKTTPMTLIITKKQNLCGSIKVSLKANLIFYSFLRSIMYFNFIQKINPWPKNQYIFFYHRGKEILLLFKSLWKVKKKYPSQQL